MSVNYGLLIVGGGPAGFSAAKAYREHERDAAVAIVADEHVMPYERPPLTKEFLRGELAIEQLPLESETWLDEQNVALISGRAVTLDTERRELSLSGGRSLSYRTCLLATGAEPTRLPVSGADHPRVQVVRTLDDVRTLLDRLSDSSEVAVIGSGFIGCEIASSLRQRGLKVALISDETAPNTNRLGPESARILRSWLEDDGVELHLGTAVERLEHGPSGVDVIAGETRVPADVVVMASGVKPRSELALAAGLELDEGAVPVDASMRTSREGLLAAGDVCKAQNLAAGRALRVEHWGDALTHGEIAGTIAAGARASWDGVPGFWSTIGDHTVQYAAWGDGFDEAHLSRHADGGFTTWYVKAGRVVGVLAHESEQDYEAGQQQIKAGAPWAS
jgi:3-phenylpropionate/trans-cinnamate dioxygenase ferredoxin reductase subunit